MRMRVAAASRAVTVVGMPAGCGIAPLADVPDRQCRDGFSQPMIFAPNHPLRPAVTALAIANASSLHLSLSLSLREGAGVRVPPMPRAVPTTLRESHGPSSSREKAEAFPLACPACGGDIRLIAFITAPAPIRKTLLHLGEPLEPPPLAPARGPPTSSDELVQVHDDRDAIQASPDDLPVIDIRSL